MTRDTVAIAKGMYPTHNPFTIPVLAIFFVLYPATVVFCVLRGRDLPGSPDKLLKVVIPSLIVMFFFNNV
jgi:hypothetical protein